MQNKTTRPYGLWSSPLSAKALSGALRFSDVAWAGEDQTSLIFSEGRGAQTVLVHKPQDQACVDLFAEHSARGGVGYGGGEFSVLGDRVWFSNKDGRLQAQSLHYGDPRPISPPFGSTASSAPSPCGSVVAYVHTDGHNDVIAVVDAQGKRWPQKLISGADFYMQPAWHPRGELLAWVSWDHPQMPWDGATLSIAAVEIDVELGEVSIQAPVRVAGATNIAAQQPCFSPDGETLAYISDESGWSQLYLYDLSAKTHRQLTAGEFDLAGPAWIQGQRSVVFDPSGDFIWALRYTLARAELVKISVASGELSCVEALGSYESLAQLTINKHGKLAMLASASTIPSRVITFDPATEAVEIIRRSSAERLAPEQLSAIEAVSWRADDGQTVHGNLFVPTNPRFEAPEGTLPPLIVVIHGGPTSQAMAGYNARAQLFATRGFAVLEVNYRGSTGYGRRYMESLYGQWGIFDVEDAIGGAKALSDAGRVDPEKVIIMGGSAGGYTVLQALTDHPGFFAAGISMYGISDLFALNVSTHKFESHYNDSLLGVLPQAAAIFRDRSPINKVERIKDPVALFQGAEDQVVPPEQAELIAKSLRQRQVEHLYHVYEGEGHGWRRPETIEHFYKAVLAFVERHVLYQ